MGAEWGDTKAFSPQGDELGRESHHVLNGHNGSFAMLDPFMIAGVIMFLNACLHTFVGGKQIAQPVVENRTLPIAVRETMLYCWHVATWSLYASAIGFAYASWSGDSVWAVASGLVALGFAAIGVIRPLVRDVTYRVLPQGWLFVPVLMATLWGLLAG